jgi:glycosyltransferase involved in cell wall biosynthesis
MNSASIIFIFNSPLSSGCDYVIQTMRIVAKKNFVYGIALGDIISFPKWLFSNDRWVVRKTDGAIVIRPISFLPGIRFRMVKLLSYVVVIAGVRLWMECKHIGQKKIIWFFEPFYISQLLFLFKGCTTLYDCVDYYPGFNDLAKTEHARILPRATHVVANSIPLATQLRKTRPDVQVVPLGFAHELFDKVPPHEGSSHMLQMTVGFVGGISDRLDFALLASVVKKLPDVQFVLVGPIEVDVFGRIGHVQSLFGQLLEEKNVTWNGQVAKKQISKIISQFDVCLIPYRVDNLFNKYSFPMKTLEYFALGKPVVSTDILSLRKYHQNKLLRIISGPDEFAQAVKSIRDEGWGVDMQKKQRKEARAMSWQQKISTILMKLK